MWSNICNSSLTITSIPSTNSQAQVYFHIKKSDKDTNNIPLRQCRERNKHFRLLVHRQLVDKPCKIFFFYVLDNTHLQR